MTRPLSGSRSDFGRTAGAPVSYGAVAHSVEYGGAGWNFDPDVGIQGNTVLPTAGLLNLVRVRVMLPTITAIQMHVAVAGSTLTASQCLAGIFNDSGALIGAGAVTADQSTGWASTGFKDMPLNSAQAYTQYSYCLVGFYFNGTTGPGMSRAASGTMVSGSNASAPFRFSTANTGLTTAMPGNIGAQTVGTVAYWVGLR